MKPETSNRLTEAGDFKNFMVEYRSEATHNQYFFEFFDDAQRKYLHLLIDQITEKDLLRVVRFREFNAYHGQWITIFESRVFHPAQLYDREDSHAYDQGEAPAVPRVSW